ncbi:MAG: amidohydrolase family protein [Myxococcota bacterium]|nr:amidohydrolase family protein [Myxococcota bacterium]
MRPFVTPILIVLALSWSGRLLANPPSRGIIDVHVHTGPKHYALLDDILTSFGVTRFINLSGGQPGFGLDEALGAAQPFETRIKVCATIAWRDIDTPHFFEMQVKMLHKAKAIGASCLKISKALGLYIPDPTSPSKLLKVDDPRLDPIWGAAGQLGMPVFIHTGDPKAFFEPADEHNERHDELSLHPGWSFSDTKYPRRHQLLNARNRVFGKHPKTTFIGVHFANNPEDPAIVDRWLDRYPNLYVDIAARVPELGRHEAAAIRRLFIKHQDRILFGTDLGFSNGGIMLGSVGRDRPKIIDIFHFLGQHIQWFETHSKQIKHPTPIQGRWKIDAIGLPQAVLRKIYTQNALRLFWGATGLSQVDEDALNTARGMPTYFE